jgi:hypothetical protein
MELGLDARLPGRRSTQRGHRPLSLCGARGGTGDSARDVGLVAKSHDEVRRPSVRRVGEDARVDDRVPGRRIALDAPERKPGEAGNGE